MLSNSTLQNLWLPQQIAMINQVRRFVWVYVLPSICLLGVITNLLNVFIFSHQLKSKNKIYRYFLVHSILDLVYVLFSLIFFMLKACLAGSYHFHYWAVFYEYLFYLLFTTILAIYMVLIELLISIKRLLLVLNLNMTFKLRFSTILAAFAVFSILNYVPLSTILFIKKSMAPVGSNSTLVKYEICYDQLVKSRSYQIVTVFPNVFRACIAPLLLIAINLVLSKKLGKQFNRKQQLHSLASASSRSGNKHSHNLQSSIINPD